MDIFLCKMSELICSRCSKVDFHEFHHKGIFNNYLIPKKNIPQKYYENYFNDIEHGLFHALCACYNYFILNDGKQFDEKVVASILLHDFLKCNEFTQEQHDKELINYFPNLLEATYTHSNPPDDNNILVKCDRIELRRYDDYKDWVDERFYNLLDELNEKQRKFLDNFYNKERPLLEYFYRNRDEVFLRHGIEKLNEFKYEGKYPPDNSYMIIDELESYPIEIDNVPFGYLNHRGPFQKGFCSNHGGRPCDIYNLIKGFITYKDFIKKGGKIINTGERDHLYALSNIDINQWVFLYQNNNKINNDSNSFNWIASCRSEKKVFNVPEMEEKNLKVMSQKTISNLFTFIKLIKNRMIVLNQHD